MTIKFKDWATYVLAGQDKCLKFMVHSTLLLFRLWYEICQISCKSSNHHKLFNLYQKQVHFRP
jgi:hypothetical protein